MKKYVFQKLSSILVIVLLLGLLPMGTVFAEDEGTPTAEPPEENPAVQQPAADTPEVEPEVEITPEVTMEEMPEPEQEEEQAAAETGEAEDEHAEDVGETEVAITPEVTLEPMTADGEDEAEDLSKVITDMAEAEVVLADESGEPLSLADEKTQELLKSGADPFFWNGSEWVGYTTISGTCPDNVTICNQVAEPFSSAVAAAPADTIIYVEGGTYNEEVVVNTAGLSFIGFDEITVPLTYDPSTELLLPDMYAYAVVDKITLNADFGFTVGVYAKEVVVNGREDKDGWLDDGFALVNDDGFGTVEADVYLRDTGPDYEIQDDHHRNNPNSTFEWECGEPDEIIYPNSSYRVIFMRPAHPTILDYYTNISGDERFDPDMAAEERLADLLIGVNLSDQGINPIDPTSFPWNFRNEERVFWYLLGETWADTNNHTVIQNGNQQDAADRIIDGSFDEIDITSGIWFLWPKQQKRSNGLWVDISPDDLLQITFIHPKNGTFGDGVWDPQGEACDPGIKQGEPGYVGGCRPDCTYCGDGVVQNEYESCDDGNRVDDDACSNSCTQDWDDSLVMDPYCVRVDGVWRMQWVISNPNSFNINANWSIPGQGSGTANLSPGSNMITTTELGTWTMDVTWATGSGSLTSTITNCETPDDPPDTPPVFAVVDELLIPVTGAELGFPAGQALSMFGVMAAGVAMIAAGIRRKFRK